MSKILLSRQGSGQIVRYIFESKPSAYVPFKGMFPLLPEWRMDEYYKLLQSKSYLEDCPEWMQAAVLQGEQMVTIDNGFQEFLKKNGKLEEFFKLDKGEKANLLVKFLDENCLGLERLQIN